MTLVKILHVENVKDLREFGRHLEATSSMFLPGKACSFTVVRDAFQGFEQLAIKYYDAVVIHEHITEFSAHDAAQVIRNINHAVPVLLLAASCSESVDAIIHKGKQAGFTHVLISPYSDSDYFYAVGAMTASTPAPNPNVYPPCQVSPIRTGFSQENFNPHSLDRGPNLGQPISELMQLAFAQFMASHGRTNESNQYARSGLFGSQYTSVPTDKRAMPTTPRFAQHHGATPVTPSHPSPRPVSHSPSESLTQHFYASHPNQSDYLRPEYSEDLGADHADIMATVFDDIDEAIGSPSHDN